MKKFFDKHNILFFAILIGGLLIDQLSKWLTTGMSKNILGTLLRFEYMENSGAAFSIFSGARVFFIILSVVATAILLFFYFYNKKKHMTLTIGLALIIAGAVGNLIDRIVFGFVKDFICLSFFPAVFNIADICVTVGVILLIIYILFFFQKEEKHAK